MIFTPFYLPIVGLIALFFLSYLRYYDPSFKFQVLAVVYFFTILLPSLLIQIVCAIINVWWKISTHSAAIGGVAGSLIVFSVIFMFNPVWWFCLVLIVAGILGSSRMILRQHTLPQVLVGFLIGIICAFLGVLYL